MKKCLIDATESDSITGLYYQEFQAYKDHDIAMRTWFSERKFLKTKIVKVIKVKQQKLLTFRNLSKLTHDPDSNANTYGIRNSELIDLC